MKSQVTHLEATAKTTATATARNSNSNSKSGQTKDSGNERDDAADKYDKLKIEPLPRQQIQRQQPTANSQQPTSHMAICCDCRQRRVGCTSLSRVPNPDPDAVAVAVAVAVASVH
ncbi:hypothetical protein AWZ03_001296 [Drosophila navojoa]|uniref:Uncharacterized protein n=1 Tax=Drosophila navojoa TaxID=7232 RepID=A0A484BUI5_DRONA|nr:hypothetical protein AWZ03_001296 [Drosophila navojoa]